MVFGGPGFAGGFVVGFISGFASRELVKVGMKVGKPIVESMKKFGEDVFEKSKENLSHMGETLEDIVAEVKSDLKKKPESAPAAAAASGGGSSTVIKPNTTQS